MSKGAISDRMDQLKKILDNKTIAEQAFPIFYKNTPKLTGNARNNTRVNKGEIQANYPYAQRLDEGYSKKRPQGMTKPTIEWIQKYIKTNVGK